MERVVGLPAGRAVATIQVARVLLLDLVAGQSFPRSGAAFDERRLEEHGPDPERVGDDLGGDPGPFEGGADDGVDGADRGGGGRRLMPPPGGERRIGLALPPSGGVPGRLSVANEEEAWHRATVRGDGTATLVPCPG